MTTTATEPAGPRSVHLLLEHDRTRSSLEDWLAATPGYAAADGSLDAADVVIADGPSFAQARDAIVEARRSIAPVFLPVVLVTPHQDATLLTGGLWRDVDEVLSTPLRPPELLVRLERLAYVRDLSRQGAERAQELSRSNSDLERYAFVAAHELRSPLTVVSGVLATLNGRYRHLVGEEAAPLLDVGWAACIRMGSLVDDILAFSRMEGPRVRMPVALGPLVAGVVETLEGDPRVAVGELPTVSADPDQLTIVFRNLLANALKFERPDDPDRRLRHRSRARGRLGDPDRRQRRRDPGDRAPVRVRALPARLDGGRVPRLRDRARDLPADPRAPRRRDPCRAERGGRNDVLLRATPVSGRAPGRP